MKKLKDLIKESKVWERNFGEKLPTLDSVQKKYEKKLNERKRFIDPDEAGQAINYALDDLKLSLSKARNPEKWAEKYHRGLPDVIEMIERVSKVLWRMK